VFPPKRTIHKYYEATSFYDTELPKFCQNNFMGIWHLFELELAHQGGIDYQIENNRGV
jgi:hypothetical protein